MTVFAKFDANDVMLATSTTDSLQEQPHNNNRTDKIQQCPQIKGKQSQLRYMNVCVINCCSIRNKLTYRPISQTVFMLSITINRAEHVCATVIIKHNYMLMCNHKIVINIMLCL